MPVVLWLSPEIQGTTSVFRCSFGHCVYCMGLVSCLCPAQLMNTNGRYQLSPARCSCACQLLLFDRRLDGQAGVFFWYLQAKHAAYCIKTRMYPRKTTASALAGACPFGRLRHGLPVMMNWTCMSLASVSSGETYGASRLGQAVT